MEKCSPVAMRKNLELVDMFKKAGIDFVPIPVVSDEHRDQLVLQLNFILKKISGEL